MANDNRTKLVFDYKGQEYTLVYSAESLKRMEKQYGIKFAKLDETVLTAPEDLFIGAFIENHSNVSRSKRLEIYNALCGSDETGKTSIAEALGEMLNETMEELKPQGNVTWRLEPKA